MQKKDDLKKYSKELVVQQNRLVEAWQGMTLTEKRLFIIASPIVRHGSFSEGEPVLITADEYAKACNIEIKTAYDNLQAAADNLFNRWFSYIDTKGNRVKCRWVYKIKYLKGHGGIELSFPSEIIYMLTIFDKNNSFTIYDKNIGLSFRGMYSLRLYELLQQYKKLGERKVEITELRNMFSLNDKYKILANFKARVIDPAIEEINELSNLIISYEQIKRGRVITAFLFTIKEKEKPKDVASVRDKNTPDMFTGFTDKELNYFASKLANDSIFGAEYAEVGEQALQFQSRIRSNLADDSYAVSYMPHLIRLGLRKKAS